jgi:hypothetical protein
MVISYFRLRAPLDETMRRFRAWIGAPEIAAPRLVRDRDAVDEAVDADDDWLGYALWVYPWAEWTVLEEISGGLETRSAAEWLALAQGGDLVFAAANDAIGYAEIVVVENGQIVRQLLRDAQDSSAEIDVGRFPQETARPLEDWIAVMSWVEADEERLTRPDEGLLWIFRYPSTTGNTAPEEA